MVPNRIARYRKRQSWKSCSKCISSFSKFFSSALDYSKYCSNNLGLSFFILLISPISLSLIEEVQSRRIFGLITYSSVLFRFRLFRFGLFGKFFINIYKRAFLFMLLRVRLLLYFLYIPILVLYRCRYVIFQSFRWDFNYYLCVQFNQFRSYDLQQLCSLDIIFNSNFIQWVTSQFSQDIIIWCALQSISVVLNLQVYLSSFN